MSKPRICKSCKWLRHRVEPCCSCSRWGKGKIDYYIPAEETLGEFLKRKEREDMGEFKTESLVHILRSNRYLADVLRKVIADRLEQLQQELIDERDRYDRMAFAEAAAAFELAQYRKKYGDIGIAPYVREEECTSSTADAVPLEVNCRTAAREAPLEGPLEGKANETDDTVRRCAEYVAEKHLQEDEAKPKIFCISGKAQHGKDTAAQYIKEYYEERGKSALVMHYSDLLKFIAHTYFGWNGEKDEDGRSLLQYVGTDKIRAQVPNYWTDFAVGLVQMFLDEWDYVILADCRFPNEVECFPSAGFHTVHLRVIRAPFVSPMTVEQQMHPSEIALDGVKADKYVLNCGTLEDYRATIRAWLEGKA